MTSSARLAAPLLGLIFLGVLFSPSVQPQEPPPPPAPSTPESALQAPEPSMPEAPAQAPAEAAAAPASVAPAAEPPVAPTPAAPKPKVVLLPAEFTVFQLGMAGPEAVPDWTTRARENLDQAIRLALEGRAGFEIVPMPSLPEPEQKVLDEHVGVARLIVFEGSRMGGKAWSTRRAEFDRRLGPGLGWLRDLSGADYAVLVAGSQYEQSGGLVFAQVLAAAAGIVMAPGGGTNVSVALIDLAAGEVKWFNSTLGVEVLGMGSIDFRKPEVTAQTLRELIAPYPRIPSLEPKP